MQERTESWPAEPAWILLVPVKTVDSDSDRSSSAGIIKIQEEILKMDSGGTGCKMGSKIAV